MVDLAEPADQSHATPPGGARTRVLLTADDSPASLRGVDRFLEQVRGLTSPVAVELLNVQAPVRGDVSTFVEDGAIKDLHHDEGIKALESVRARLEQAGIPCVVHIGVGDFTHVVIHYAKSLDAKQIYVTETERLEGDDLDQSVGHMSEHVSLPVTIVR